MAESAVVSSAQWLGLLLIQEANILMGVQEQVQKLQQQLELMQEYLRDADSNPGREVRALTDHMRKLACDAEDLIDAYILKVSPRTQLSDRNWLVKSTRYAYKAPRAYRLGKQMQVLLNEVNEVMNKFITHGVSRISHLEETCTGRKSPSYPYDQGECVVGWEKDIQKLVQVLMGEGTHQEVRVLTIMGMGGSGKTTLARKLYNHPYIREYFDCCAWVFISQQWNSQHVMFEILRQVGGTGSQKINSVVSNEELIEKLRSILERKSYLVVLDDVWRRKALEEIFHAIPKGNNGKGSKIIITTRNQAIAQFQSPNCSYVFEPSPLNEEQGWELLSKFALNCRRDFISDAETQSFELLGKEMLRQCDGLPLAIVALAGILSTRASIGEWQQVSDSVRTRVMEGTGTHMSDKVDEILALSYDDLPHYLKPCFLHLGNFPEDCEIPTGMLTRMWIAEGFITSRKNISPEDVATQCLEELRHRFMIQVVRTNFKREIKTIRLHDLLRDLCITKAEELNFLEVYSPKEPTTCSGNSITIQPRRAALHSSLSLPAHASHLRSLVLLTRSSVSDSAYRSKEIVDLSIVPTNFKLLRVLCLWGIKTAGGFLPEQIGRLTHLRYLGIRASNITQLPKSIGNLRNLLTLDYRNVESDNSVQINIPNVLWKLELLRHLFLPIDCSWNVEELKLSTISNLQTLWGIMQDAGSHWLPRELQMLSKTLKKIWVVVSTQEELTTVFSCPCIVFDGLRTFRCELRGSVALCSVKPISHLQHLNKLTVIGQIRMELTPILPTNLVILELKDSMLEDSDPMSALGQLAHLKLLRLSNFYVGSSFSCELGSFPQLEELYLESLRNLNSWIIKSGAMQRLKKLGIIGCPNLAFPFGLEQITTLQHLEFFGVNADFRRKAREHGWSIGKFRLPHNCEAIIEQCDSPVNISSVRKLYEQLAAGVFLNNKKQKYWVIKQYGNYQNCFMLSALDLFVCLSSVDEVCPSFPLDDFELYRLQKVWDQIHMSLNHLPWVPIEQLSDLPRLITVLSAYQEQSQSESDHVTLVSRVQLQGSDNTLMVKEKPFPDAVQVAGKFNTVNLSPQVTYEVGYVVMIPKSESRMHSKGVLSRIIPPDRRCISNRHTLHDKPTDDWIRLSVGEIQSSSDRFGETVFVLCDIVPGLRIQGIVIEPKSCDDAN